MPVSLEFISEGFMATYGLDCDNSYSHNTGVRTSSEGDDTLLSRYLMLSPTRFTNMASFKKRVMACYNGFVVESNVHHQYMAFTDVSCKWLGKIDKLREGRTPLPKMVVLYDGTEEVLIVKFMPSALHGAAVMQFHDLFIEKLKQLGVKNSIYPVLSARFGDEGERCKEGDSSYIPIGRHKDGFPSLVVEVGLCESLQMLKNDAWHWLKKSGGETRIVIILHIVKSSRKIVLQRWECVDDIYPCCAAIDYPPRIQAIQSLDLVHGVPYVGDALEIPAAKVFDVVPSILANGEFVFTREELQHFSDFFWSQL